MHLNVEIKARTNDIDATREWLLSNNADYKGLDKQTDTYFNVANGRLKLRQGNIENALIHYKRENQAEPKDSQVTMTHVENDEMLKQVLRKACGVLVEVIKKREIYFIGNVKFHFDTVQNLGTFIEVEAIDTNGSIGKEKLQEQCDHYAAMFTIKEEDFMADSYSDMIMQLKNN